MHIVQKPSKVETFYHRCDFHKRHPGRNYPGCTCSGGFRRVEKPESEWTEEERRWYYAALRGETPDGDPLY